MEKPTISHFAKYYDIFYHQYERYLPTSFDESLSILEKINKVILQLNQIGKLTNDVVEQWNKIMEWVMDDGVSEAVVNKLDVMMKNGEFHSIINEQILGSKASIFVSKAEPESPDNTTFWYAETDNFEWGNPSKGDCCVCCD